MGDNPDIQWALDLLTPEPDYKPPLLIEHGLVVLTPISLFFGACIRNRIIGRPSFAGFHVHIISSIVGYVAAYKFKELFENHFARRDQMLKHYIMLHPEDFPQPERKKWGEVFEPWTPIR